MKWDLSKTNLTFDVKKRYSRDELQILLKENKFEEEIGPLEAKKHWMSGEYLETPGVDGYIIMISPKKSKIMVSQVAASGKARLTGLVQNFGPGAAGLALMQTRGIKGNAGYTEMIAEWIQKIVT